MDAAGLRGVGHSGDGRRDGGRTPAAGGDQQRLGGRYSEAVNAGGPARSLSSRGQLAWGASQFAEPPGMTWPQAPAQSGQAWAESPQASPPSGFMALSPQWAEFAAWYPSGA